MEKVIEYENAVFKEFNELFTDLLNTLNRKDINNKLTVVDRIKSINEQIKMTNDSINGLLIDIHQSEDNINVPKKELDRINEDQNWKKMLTAFFPQMFLYNLLVNKNKENDEECISLDEDTENDISSEE